MDLYIRNMINSLTSDIIKMFNINIPIRDMTQLVEDLGGAIEVGKFSLGGNIKKDENGFKITLSSFQDEKRKRFIIAHELGHLFLHMGYLTNKDLWNKQNNNVYYRTENHDKEYQANEFAMSLLMPKLEYFEIMKKYTKGNYTDILKIAEYFNVSVDMVFNRGKFLELGKILFTNIKDAKQAFNILKYKEKKR